MSIFDSLKKYGGKWTVIQEQKFTAEDLQGVTSAVTVPSKYGTSVCITFISGVASYIPLANDCPLGLGEPVDLKNATVLTLAKEGEANIYRITVK